MRRARASLSDSLLPLLARIFFSSPSFLYLLRDRLRRREEEEDLALVRCLTDRALLGAALAALLHELPSISENLVIVDAGIAAICGWL